LLCSNRLGECPVPLASTDLSLVRAEMPPGMGPVKEFPTSTRSLHRGTCTHQGAGAHPPPSTFQRRASYMQHQQKTEDCHAPMASTHVSEVRAEMPSGMVPLRESVTLR
jgi:hypothetical protein